MKFPYTPHDRVIRDYASRGLIVLSPQALEIPESIHTTIFEKECEAFHARDRIDAVRIPEIIQVINAPGVVRACDQLLGKNWAIVPFTHNTPFLSGSNDQHWHKDDNGPYNMRKVRHHHAVQVEMLYYPQAVALDMGPTATVPYSQYWTFNHEENHDNFAGADHLDFSYQLSGMERIPISGQHSEYSTEDIVNRNTPHDERMRNAVLDLEWPLCSPFEVGPLDAGSVVLYSHNLLHRGNHRRDDWHSWRDNPRFMWRFWLYRTEEPKRLRGAKAINWHDDEFDAVTQTVLEEADEGVTSIWNYQANWMRGVKNPGGAPKPKKRSNPEFLVDLLAENLFAPDDSSEPVRIGAAYQLAQLATRKSAQEVLQSSLYSDRESVRRAATYGLIAAGSRSTEILVDATKSDSKWVRKAGTFGLGEVGRIEPEVTAALMFELLEENSIYVRSVAASALGCYARRAIKQRLLEPIPIITEAFIVSLAHEMNRLSMDRAQNRSIKFVRPTDECDICEGIGFDYGHKRFEPVRSAVRENILWSSVILCSHGCEIFGERLSDWVTTLSDVVSEDKNLFNVGLAMDSLFRLAWLLPDGKVTTTVQRIRKMIPTVFASSPIRCDDSLSRSVESIQSLVASRKKSADPAASLPGYEVVR